jgi:histone acetyltransferase
METKLENNGYATVDDFVADAQLIFDNCRLYNPEGTVYVKNATKMEKFVKDQVATKLRRDN